MALSLIDGTNANVDLAITTDGTTATSRKCMFSQMTLRFLRDLFSMTTFCSPGYVERRTGLKDLMAILSGFIGIGTGALPPLPTNVLSAAELPLVVTTTFTTSNSVQMSGYANDDVLTMSVQQPTSRVLNIMGTGAPTVTWATT